MKSFSTALTVSLFLVIVSHINALGHYKYMMENNRNLQDALITCDELIQPLCDIQLTTGNLTIRNLTLQYYIYNSTDRHQGAPYIGVHGGPGAGHNEQVPLKKLACLGHPVILYDQVGCGQSSFVADPAKDAPWLLTIDYYIEELNTLIRHLDLKEYYVNGHSWGTVVAQEFALSNYTQGLKGLILDGALSDSQLYINSQFKYDIEPNVPSYMVKLIKDTERNQSYNSPIYQQINNVLGKYFTLRMTPTPDCLMGPGKFNPQIYLLMQGPSEFSVGGVLENWNITGRLNQINVPTLVVRGEFDSMTEECSLAIVNNIKLSWPLVTIPRSGHMKMIDEANIFIDEVNKFLNILETQEQEEYTKKNLRVSK